MVDSAALDYPITGITVYPDPITGAKALTSDLGISPVTSAAELAAAFLAGFGAATREAYAGDLRAWGAFLTDLGVHVLDAHRVHADAFVRDAEERGLAPATVARRLSALNGLYDYALDEGLVARSPIAHVRRPRVSDQSARFGVDRDEMRALLAVARRSGARDYALLCLLGLSGLRVTEALGADVADLGSQRGHRVLRVLRKGGKRQTVALAPRTAVALDELLAGRREGPVFSTRSGRRVDRHAAAKTVQRLAGSAGIEHRLSPHSLRHGFVTLALDAGVSLRDVQDAAGHADPRTTRRYDRGRYALDRAATYAVAAHVAAPG